MRIEFNQTQEDIISFYQYNFWFSDERKDYRLISRISFGLILMSGFWLIVLNLNSLEIKSTVGLIVFSFFIFVLGITSVKPAILGHWRKAGAKLSSDKTNSELFGHKIMEFTNEKILWSCNTSRGESSIDTIKKIKQDKNYFYLYNTSISAYVIPKHALKDEENIKRFEEIINNYQQGI